MYHPSLTRTLGDAANMTDIGELPEYFWLNITATVLLVLLALLAVSALGAWTVSLLENLWQRYRWHKP